MRARLKQLKHAKIWYIKSQNGFFLCFYFAFFYLLYHLIWVMTFTWWCIKQQKRLCYTRCGVEMENGFDSVRVMIEALFFHSEFSLESLHSCFSFSRYQLATYTIIIYVCICLEASLSSSSWHEWERGTMCCSQLDLLNNTKMKCHMTIHYETK